MLSNLIKRIIGSIWRFGWNFRCDYCGKFMPLNSITGDHSQCEDEMYSQCDKEQREQEEAENQIWEDNLHMQDILNDFCNHYGCWELDGLCYVHNVCADCGVPSYHCSGECQLNDSYDEPETCACGEPVGILCVCAELASLARHNADPDTRGSWWVA